jgi:hypothetical protein
MLKTLAVITVLAGSTMLMGCGYSDGNAGTFPSPKEFAHRYNKLASDNLQAVEVKDIGGVEGEDWTEIELADKSADSISTNAGSNAFNYNPRYVSKDVIKQVCAWMVQSANRNISSADAMAMATSALDHQTKMVVHNTVLTFYPTHYDNGCTVYYTGL